MFFNPPWPHERLDKLMRLLLSTTFDGEREAAARAIGRLLASHRLPILAAAIDYATKRGWTIFPAPWRRARRAASRRASRPHASAMAGAGGRRATWSRSRPTGCAGRTPISASCAGRNPASGWSKPTSSRSKASTARAALAWLEQLNGKLPPTLMAISPSGSVHRYYNWPGDAHIRNSASKLGRGHRCSRRGRHGDRAAKPTRNGTALPLDQRSADRRRAGVADRTGASQRRPPRRAAAAPIRPTPTTCSTPTACGRTGASVHARRGVARGAQVVPRSGRLPAAQARMAAALRPSLRGLRGCGGHAHRRRRQAHRA